MLASVAKSLESLKVRIRLVMVVVRDVERDWIWVLSVVSVKAWN